MRLRTPRQSIAFYSEDIYGKPINLASFIGKRVVLYFFNSIDSPGVHPQLSELNHYQQQWGSDNLQLVAIFSSTAETLSRYHRQHPCELCMVADPQLKLYQQYRIEYRTEKGSGPTKMIKPGLDTQAIEQGILPAAFLIEVDGTMADCWYGYHSSDYIPLDKIDRFANPLIEGLMIKERRELQQLRKENKQLKITLQSLRQTMGVKV